MALPRDFFDQTKKSKIFLVEFATGIAQRRTPEVEKVINDTLKKNSKKMLVYKTPVNLNEITNENIKRFIVNRYNGPDIKSCRQKNKNNKANKAKKYDEKWYRNSAKSWFNQRIFQDSVFGDYWKKICKSIHKICDNDRLLFLKCMHGLINATVEFGKTTKEQPLLQASIMNKCKGIIKWFKDCDICDINAIREIGKAKLAELTTGDKKQKNKYNAKLLRIDILNELWLLVQNDGIKPANTKRNVNLSSYKGTRGQPFNCQTLRHNAMGYSDEKEESYKELMKKYQEVVREKERLKAENEQYKLKYETLFHQHFSSYMAYPKYSPTITVNPHDTATFGIQQFPPLPMHTNINSITTINTYGQQYTPNNYSNNNSSNNISIISDDYSHNSSPQDDIFSMKQGSNDGYDFDYDHLDPKFHEYNYEFFGSGINNIDTNTIIY